MMSTQVYAVIDRETPRFALALAPLIATVGQSNLSFNLHDGKPGLNRYPTCDVVFVEWGTKNALHCWKNISTSRRILTIPDMAALDRESGKLESVFSAADQVVVYQTAMQQALAQYHPSINDRMILIDLVPQIATGVRANPLPHTFVSIGPIVWQAGYEFAVDAVGLAVREGRDVVYRLFGDGPYLDAVIYAARQWGIWKTPHFVHQPLGVAADWVEALAQAQALIHPLLEPDDGIMPRLAAQLGIPVLNHARDSRALKTAMLAPKPPPDISVPDLAESQQAFIHLFRSG